MDTKIINSISECHALWEKFKQDTHMWTEWDIVMTFFDEKIYKPHFILMIEEGREVGLITLWLDLRDNKYTHFGGERMENRTFWVEEKYYMNIRELLPADTYLFDMKGEQIDIICKIDPLFENLISERDKRFFINLENIKTLDDYFSRFGKKHKKNLLRDLKMLQPLNYNLKWTHTNHIERFVELSVARFEEESDFHDETNKQEMNSFTSHAEKKGMLQTLLIEINGKIEGAELAVRYHDTYCVINGGYNPQYKNLGKLLIIEHIKKAIALKSKEIDFMVGDSGWKELWNLDTEECITIIKK